MSKQEQNKGPVAKVVDRVRKGWNPQETGEKAGIDFLNRGGFQKDRFAKIEDMDNRSFIEQDSKYQTAVVPWMNIRENDFLFDKNDAFYDLKLAYDELISHINTIKKRKIIDLNEKIHDENMQRKLEGGPRNDDGDIELIKPFDMKYLDNAIVDTELDDLREKMENILVWGAKMNMGLSWSDPDDNKSLVLNKQVIVEPNPQTSEIFRLLKQVQGPEQLSEPENMSK